MSSPSVLITGTTSGVGRALLEHYVERGVPTVAVNRRVVSELESAFPQVTFECVDVRDGEAVETLIVRLSESGRLPETFFLNAGVSEIDNDEIFDMGAFRDVTETNLFGVLHFVASLTKLPPAASPRHLVAMSSMARYVGNPYGLGYFTSKRSLSACFDAWSRMYTGTDLVFQQVMLGPVPTGIKTMEGQFPNWMVKTRDLFSGDLAECVDAIVRFAETDRRQLFTPKRAVALYLGMKLGTSLIPGFFQGKTTLAGRPRRRSLSAQSRDR